MTLGCFVRFKKTYLCVSVIRKPANPGLSGYIATTFFAMVHFLMSIS